MPTNAIMSNCSGNAISDAFERVVKLYIPSNRLIGRRNFFLNDTARRMNGVLSPIPSGRQKQLEEYIASSVIVHCSDGWSYLSRSIDSLLNGDIASSIHFAYYAELRSAMSIMASEGVGVFDKQHVWFDSDKNATFFKKDPTTRNRITTHSAVDMGMLELSRLTEKKENIFKLFKVNNKTVDAWIRETGFSSKSKYATSITNQWLKKWSIDLHLHDDQQLRNEMSYRPHFNISSIDMQSTIDKLTQIWDLLEPTQSNGFPNLDQHLLRITLEEIYRKSGSASLEIPYELYLKRIFNRLGENVTQPLFDFLRRETNSFDAILLTEAKKDSGNIDYNKNDPFPIISRAILLLRLSTGSANKLISSSSLNIDNLRFWWEKLSFQHGFVGSIPSEIDIVDLYSDIRDSINDISTMPSGSFTSIKNAFSSSSIPLFYLKQFERPAIWGMCL